MDKKTNLLTQLDRLAATCSEENWDSYGASPVRKEAVEMTRQLIDMGVDPDKLTPMIEGGIQLSWNSEDFTVEINGADELAGIWLNSALFVDLVKNMCVLGSLLAKLDA